MKTTQIALLLIAAAVGPTAVASEVSPAPRYVECKIRRNAWPIFPQRMLYQGITHGDASIMVEIGTTGAVSDILLISYTHPDFGAEAMDAVKRWTYEPGRLDGRPVVSVLKVNFEFTVNGIVVYDRHFDAIKPEEYAANRYAYFPHGPDTLDGKLVAVNTSSPGYPEAWVQEGRKGQVTLRFFVDETGRPRMPVVVMQSDSLLASSAAAAVKEWRFQPPLSSGKPVLAYAEQVFVFEPPAKDGSS